MTRVQLGQMLDGADANGDGITRDARARRRRRRSSRPRALGLLEYVEPKYDLSMVAGMPAVKERLRRAARAIARGNPAAVPMGYLVCGPVGSAKTFLVECFANEIGFPCVKLQATSARCGWARPSRTSSASSRSSSSLTPVGVVIDEADAALGNREASGDSGTQNRVFAQIAALHGRHPQPRQDPLVPHHLPARPPADRPEAPGARRGAHPALLSGDGRRSTTRSSA